MKVLCSSDSFAKYSNRPIEMLQEHGLELVRIDSNLQGEALFEVLVDAVAMITAFTPTDQAFFEHAPQMKIICKHGVGVDNIDLDAASHHHVYITNVPNANKHAVADHTFGMLIGVARQIAYTCAQTKAGLWPKVFSTDVYGKTLGILGLGNIGQQVALRASGFNMKVMAYDPFPDEGFAREHDITLCSIDEVLKTADFVSLHLPLLEPTYHLLGQEKLALMKPSAFLVNCSRGGLVDELALYQALTSGELAGAAMDVFETEPNSDSPLLTLDNFVATSHVAGYTDGAINELGIQAVQNIIDLLVHQQTPHHVVNRM
jgi:D-3-phosphoglycerate dehydrogenase